MIENSATGRALKLVCGTLCLVTATTASAQLNLVANPGFDTDTAGWSFFFADTSGHDPAGGSPAGSGQGSARCSSASRAAPAGGGSNSCAITACVDVGSQAAGAMLDWGISMAHAGAIQSLSYASSPRACADCNCAGIFDQGTLFLPPSAWTTYPGSQPIAVTSGIQSVLISFTASTAYVSEGGTIPAIDVNFDDGFVLGAPPPPRPCSVLPVDDTAENAFGAAPGQTWQFANRLAAHPECADGGASFVLGGIARFTESSTKLIDPWIVSMALWRERSGAPPIRIGSFDDGPFGAQPAFPSWREHHIGLFDDFHWFGWAHPFLPWHTVLARDLDIVFSASIYGGRLLTVDRSPATPDTECFAGPSGSFPTELCIDADALMRAMALGVETAASVSSPASGSLGGGTVALNPDLPDHQATYHSPRFAGFSSGVNLPLTVEIHDRSQPDGSDPVCSTTLAAPADTVDFDCDLTAGEREAWAGGQFAAEVHTPTRTFSDRMVSGAFIFRGDFEERPGSSWSSGVGAPQLLASVSDWSTVPLSAGGVGFPTSFSLELGSGPGRAVDVTAVELVDADADGDGDADCRLLSETSFTVPAGTVVGMGPSVDVECTPPGDEIYAVGLKIISDDPSERPYKINLEYSVMATIGGPRVADCPPSVAGAGCAGVEIDAIGGPLRVIAGKILNPDPTGDDVADWIAKTPLPLEIPPAGTGTLIFECVPTVGELLQTELELHLHNGTVVRPLLDCAAE